MNKKQEKLFKDKVDSKIVFGLVPFVHSPYNKKPIRHEGCWWQRESYWTLTPWKNIKQNKKQPDIKYMGLDELVAVFKDDINKSNLGSIVDEFPS